MIAPGHVLVVLRHPLHGHCKLLQTRVQQQIFHCAGPGFLIPGCVHHLVRLFFFFSSSSHSFFSCFSSNSSRLCRSLSTHFSLASSICRSCSSSACFCWASSSTCFCSSSAFLCSSSAFFHSSSSLHFCSS